MPCVTLRQEKDHINSLQYAFFNGVCFNAWENIFGVWNGVTPRAAEALRRVAAIYRAFAPYFSSQDWEPHTPTVKEGVYASKFPGAGGTVWTLINKNPQDQSGAQIIVPYSNQTFYDLWNGQVLEPNVQNGQAILSFAIEEHGFGAIFAAPQKDETLEQGLLAKMREWASQRLASIPNTWTKMKQTMVPIVATRPQRQAPAGMVTIPVNQRYHFKVDGLVIEAFAGAGVQFPWEDEPDLDHSYTVAISSFHMDKNLVTNEEFKEFLQQTHYHSLLKEWDQHNFLKHWTMEREATFAPGTGKKPVVWVSLADARAYCQWAGKRLPNDWEWQYAAQGNDRRPFPWGWRWDSAKVPKRQIRKLSSQPEDVGRHPAGASRFGVQDMIGHVWQWTNEFHDQGTRRALVRGGSFYCPDPKGDGADWSFKHTSEDGACKPNRVYEHGNYLLMSPSLDRAETIGFRCVVDAE
jgi:formylglycine-generating enzyme required for sulfatase activity